MPITVYFVFRFVKMPDNFSQSILERVGTVDEWTYFADISTNWFQFWFHHFDLTHYADSAKAWIYVVLDYLRKLKLNQARHRNVFCLRGSPMSLRHVFIN